MNEYTELAVNIHDAYKEFRLAGFSDSKSFTLALALLTEIVKGGVQGQAASS